MSASRSARQAAALSKIMAMPLASRKMAPRRWGFQAKTSAQQNETSLKTSNSVGPSTFLRAGSLWPNYTAVPEEDATEADVEQEPAAASKTVMPRCRPHKPDIGCVHDVHPSSKRALSTVWWAKPDTTGHMISSLGCHGATKKGRAARTRYERVSESSNRSRGSRV